MEETNATASENAANEARENQVAEKEAAVAAQEQKQPTPDDINKLVMRESRKEVEKLLKNAGITPGDDPEMQLKEYKKWLDSQKSDLEKALGDAKSATGERDDAIAKLKSVERCMLAVSKGVPADRAERYIKLAETYLADDGDYAKALEAALADFPIGVAKQAQEPPSKAGTHIENNNEPKMDMNTFLRTKG